MPFTYQFTQKRNKPTINAASLNTLRAILNQVMLDLLKPINKHNR